MKMALGLLTLLVGFSAFAQNPLIRICNVTGGEFHEVRFSDDQVGFCQYGLALLDAASILDVTSGAGESQAIAALKSTADTCALAGGKVRQGLDFEDLEGLQLNFCEFRDGSLIELSTLKAGSEASSNEGLMKALNTRF